MRETNRDLHGRALVTLPRALLFLALVLLLGLVTFAWLNAVRTAPITPATEAAQTLPPHPSPAAPLTAARAPDAIHADPAPVPVTTTEPPPEPAGRGESEDLAATTPADSSPDDPAASALAGALATAAANEAQADWALALLDYEQALAIDPDSAAARAGRERARQAIAGEKFQAAMSTGLTALANAEFEAALQAFEAARRFDPESPELADGVAQAKAGLQRQRIARLEREAARSEATERWQEAFATYQQALVIDPSLAFARSGQARTKQLAEAQVQLDYYLDKPELLYSHKAREEAQRFLEERRALRTGGKRLTQSFVELEQRLREAATPLPVELRSDGETEVAVYHVGRLGQFESYRLELLPGDYTIVGSRPGYRDVRRLLRVRPKSSPQVAEVVCQERI